MYEIGCTIQPNATLVCELMPAWIRIARSVTPATYQSSIVRRRTRSTEKKISAETASMATGVTMYITGTYSTP